MECKKTRDKNEASTRITEQARTDPESEVVPKDLTPQMLRKGSWRRDEGLSVQELNSVQHGKSRDDAWEGGWEQHLHTRQELRRWST